MDIKIKDKYSILIKRNPKHISIIDKDIDLLTDTIGNRIKTNNFIEEVTDIVRVYFNKYRWKADIFKFNKTVFVEDAYHIKLRKNNDKSYALKIILQEK